MSSSKRKITRSRLGCHRCKRLKVKCPEQKPACAHCLKAGAECDYTLKLTWGGRPFKNASRATKASLTIYSYNDLTPRSESPMSEPSKVQKNTPVESSFQLVQKPNPGPTQMSDSEGISPRPSSVISNSLVNASESVLGSPMHGHEYAVKNEPIEHQSLEEEPLVHTPLGSVEQNSIDMPLNNALVMSPSFPGSDVGSDSLSFELDKFLTDRGIDGSHSPKSFPFHTDTLGDVISTRNTSFFGELEPSFHHVSIPPSISPEPEILANVPYYKELFHFWINVAAENLVPAPSLYKDNPFKKLLPQMAMHYHGLLTTILAFAARAKGALTNLHGQKDAIVDHLLKRSCVELIGMLQDKSKSTSDGTLATSLLLSCYEVCHCNDLENHRTHTLGAAQIFVERSKRSIMLLDPGATNDDDSASDKTSSSQRSTSTKVKRSEDDVTFFLARWFIYVDVVGALSSTRNRHNYLRSFRTGQKYTPVDSIPNLDFDNQDTDRNIDFLLGFDEKLLPHMINISFLIDQVENYMNNQNADPTCLPQEITIAALELKDRFEKDCQAEEAKRENKIDRLIENGNLETEQNTRRTMHQNNLSRLVEQNNILRSTNRLYSLMALLNLYRRVLLLPRQSHLVQELIDEMTEILKTCIAPGSPGDICTIFPTFCAGCDTLDPEKKQFYFERLNYLAQNGNMGAHRGIAIMRRCWATGEDWFTAANMMGVDLVLM